MPQSSGGTIHEIPQQATQVEHLLGAVLESERKNADGTFASQQTPVGLLMQAILENLPGANNLKVLRKAVRWQSADVASPAYDQDGNTLASLNAAFLALGTVCNVEFCEDGLHNQTFRLEYDRTGPLSVWQYASFTGPKVPARWVRVLATGGDGQGSISLTGITEFRDRFGDSFDGGLLELAQTLLIKPYPPSGSLYADAPTRLYGGPTAAILHWSVSKGSNEITRVTVAGQLQPAGQTSGTVSVSATANTGSSFALQVVDASGREFNALTYVTYGNKRYWGVSSQDPLTLSDAALSALIRGLSQELSASRQQEREFDCANQYIVYAWIGTAGAGNFYLNGLSNTAFQSKTFAFDNGETGEGHLQTFRVSRNGSLLSGHFSSKVS